MAKQQHDCCALPPLPSVQLKTLVLAHNNLSGPAFPPTWLEPDSMPALQSLTLDGNKCLGGALPANLSWPDLETL